MQSKTIFTPQKNIPWHCEIPYSPPETFIGLAAEAKQAAYLDYCPQDPRGRYAYLCLDPVDLITAETSDPFGTLSSILKTYGRSHIAGLPFFQGGAVGIVSYDFAFASLTKKPILNFPALFLAIYPTIAAFDTHAKRAWIISSEAHKAERLQQQMASHRPTAIENGPWQGGPILTQTLYEDIVATTIRHIHAGDIYQANISYAFKGHFPQPFNLETLYRRLRSETPAPYSALLKCGGEKWIASASPERFLSLSHHGMIETRPIKGTRPRHDDPVADRREAAALSASEKDRAENLMIVDLMRNDLGRVAIQGSITVETLCGIETFASVHHLVSVIQGRLRPEFDAIDLLRAAFPGGSITGAPKLKAMEIITALEPAPRGPFCGNIVALGFDGALESSIVIRTLYGDGPTAIAQAGSGIVADSVPRLEYEESMLKLLPLLRTLELSRL